MEFAFVAIILFMVIFGIIDFSRALFAYHFVANAAREGTRYASVRGATCASPPMTDCGYTQIQTNLRNEAAAIGMNSSQLSATATTIAQPTDPAICTTLPNSPGCTVRVNVSYQFSFALPFLPVSPLTMSSTSATVFTQ